MGIEHWMQLSLTSGLGPILIGRLVDRVGSAENATRATVQDIQEIEGIGQTRAGEIHAAMKSAEADARKQMDRAAELGAHLICPEDAAYPPLLRHIPDPPAVLYVLGDIEPRDLQSLAIVGSRDCSFYGREQAERFGALLAGAGFTVVSGGARGIDSAAHRGALQHPSGRTIAVLGSGIDVPYPPESKDFFDQIARRGAVISEYPLGTKPAPENFPRRNRIISGISRGVLVVEAAERSGALITARQANEDQNRPVFAVPGRVDNPRSAGCHKLIRDGAILTTCLEDIQQELGPVPHGITLPNLLDEVETPAPPASTDVDEPAGLGEAANPGLTDRQSSLLAVMDKDPVAVDQLIDRTGLDAAAILQELTFLSLKGAVRRIDGQTYARVR